MIMMRSYSEAFGHLHRPRRSDIAAGGSQDDVERLLFGDVDELQRDRRTEEFVGVDDLRLPDARPLLQDLLQRDVLRDERDATRSASSA